MRSGKTRSRVMTKPTLLFVSAPIFFFPLFSVKEVLLPYQIPTPPCGFWIPSSNLLKLCSLRNPPSAAPGRQFSSPNVLYSPSLKKSILDSSYPNSPFYSHLEPSQISQNICLCMPPLLLHFPFTLVFIWFLILVR